MHLCLCFLLNRADRESNGAAGSLSANAGDSGLAGSIPESGRSPGGGNSNHSTILAWKNPMDSGACQATSPWGHKELNMTEQLNIRSRVT